MPPAPDAEGTAGHLGVPGYRPRWLTGVRAIAAAHGDRLRALVGRTLTRTWLVCDARTGAWMADWPVVICFEDDRIEISHQKFDELSLTWGSIDLSRPIDWPPDWEQAPVWTADPLAGLPALRGQPLRSVALLERSGADHDLANGSVAVHLAFPEGQLTVFNGLDENSIDLDPPSPEYRRHTLIG